MNLRLQQIRIQQAADAKAKAAEYYIKFTEPYEHKPMGLPDSFNDVNDYAAYMGAAVSQPTTPAQNVRVYHQGDINQQIIDAERESERRRAEREQYARIDITSSVEFANMYKAIIDGVPDVDDDFFADLVDDND